jgi:tRNA threonylcarbamoyladenosine dehydratase
MIRSFFSLPVKLTRCILKRSQQGVSLLQINQYTKNSYVDAMLDRTKSFFSGAELENVRNATVAIVGVGASGSMVAELLARWGISRFRLLDMDKYELSNINRQIFATSKTLGRWKAEVAAERIGEINPFADIECSINEKLTLENADSFIKGATIVINASDTKSGLFLIHNFAHRYRIPVIEGHGWNMTGIKLRVFDYRKPSQKKYDEPFRLGVLNRFLAPLFDSSRKDFSHVTQEDVDRLDSGGNETGGGSLGTTTTLVGCAIAAETIKLLTGKGKMVYHPLEIHLDLFSLRMLVAHKNSIRNIISTVVNRRHEILRNLGSRIAGRKRGDR